MPDPRSIDLLVLTPPSLVPARYNGQRDFLIAEPKINLTRRYRSPKLGDVATLRTDSRETRTQVIASLICSPRKVPEFRDHAQRRSPIPACVKVGVDRLGHVRVRPWDGQTRRESLYERHVRSTCQRSVRPAIHVPSRGSPRSSSTGEPSDPPFGAIRSLRSRDRLTSSFNNPSRRPNRSVRVRWLLLPSDHTERDFSADGFSRSALEMLSSPLVSPRSLTPLWRCSFITFGRFLPCPSRVAISK